MTSAAPRSIETLGEAILNLSGQIDLPITLESSHYLFTIPLLYSFDFDTKSINIGLKGGRNNIGAGFEVVMQDIFGRPGDRPNAENVIILVTDGLAGNVNTQAGLDAIQRAKRDARVMVIFNI